MNTNIFICHRPYHYCFSAVIAKHVFKNRNNFCINFDVYTFKKNNETIDYSMEGSLSKYDNMLSGTKLFNNVYWLSRHDEKSIWNIVTFYKYYTKIVRELKALVNKFSSCENLFIFSDKEKPVEVLALLIKEQYRPNVYLIDEGVVSYYYRCNYIKKAIKWLIVHSLRLKYIGDNFNYGESKIFDYFITYNKNKIAIPIKKTICEINPPKFSILKPYFNIKLPELNTKTVLYISTPISEGGYSKEKEFLILNNIVNFWNKWEFMVVLKLHPLEENNKFENIPARLGVSIIKDKNIPPEIFYEDTLFITGLLSSALLNASRLPNKIVLSYNMIFGWGRDEESLRICKQHGINMVSSLNDIENIILSPKNHITKSESAWRYDVFDIMKNKL